MNAGGMRLQRLAAHPAHPGRASYPAGAGVGGVWGPVAALAEGSRRIGAPTGPQPPSKRGGGSMRVTVTADDTGPLLIALECAPLGVDDAGDLADHVARAARVWWHGPAEAPEAPERPEPPEIPEVPERPDPTGDELRRAAYVLLDRGRSVAQAAAALGVSRDEVREWDRRGRW